MNPDHLLELAGQILRIGGTGTPRQVTINRAVSTAYYALFHALVGECVARLAGLPRPSRYWQIVTPIHRSLERGAARKVFERLIRPGAASPHVQLIDQAFLELQSARNAADYDPGSRCSRSRALDFIVQVDSAIEALRSMPKEDRLILVVQLITKPR